MEYVPFGAAPASAAGVHGRAVTAAGASSRSTNHQKAPTATTKKATSPISTFLIEVTLRGEFEHEPAEPKPRLGLPIHRRIAHEAERPVQTVGNKHCVGGMDRNAPAARRPRPLDAPTDERAARAVALG